VLLDLGRRSRPTSEIETSLDYLTGERRFTDILVYNTSLDGRAA
jgi:hypothetical protein